LQRKLNRDLRLLRMDFAVNPQDSSTLVHLGMAYLHLGRWTDARQHLRRVLDITTTRCEHLRQVFCALARIDIHEGKLHDALAMIDQGLSHFPRGEYLLFLRAECLYELDRFAEARATLIALLAASGEPQYRGGVPAEIRNKLAPRRLADIYRMERDFLSAETLLKAVVARHPDDTISWYLLGRVYLDSRQQQQLLALHQQLRRCPQGEIFASLLLATWHLERSQLEDAGRVIDHLISTAPQMPLPRILRAEWLTRTAAPTADRIHACRDILRLQPGNLDAQRMLQHLERTQREVPVTAQSYATAGVTAEGLPASLGI